MVRKGNREAIAGTAAIALAFTGVLYLITDLVFTTQVAIAVAVVFFALTAWRWWVIALYRKAREQAAAAELQRTALNWSCRYRTAGNGRRNTPDAYGSLATVRSTAASSRACRVCRAWGTISRSPSRPSHSTAPATRRTRPCNTCTVASPGFSCSDIDAPAVNAIRVWRSTCSWPP